MNWRLTLLCCALLATIGGIVLSIRTPALSTRPYITVMGRVKMADGLGRHAAEFIDAFCDEVDLHFHPTGGVLLADTPMKSRPYLQKQEKRPAGKIVLCFEPLKVQTTLHLPKRMDPLTDKSAIRIAYTMFESSAIPPSWVAFLNTYFDAVVVPDAFLVDVYQNSGVTLPIFAIPLAVELSDFLSCPLKTAPHTPFVFSNFSASFPRKNQVRLIQAFHLAFGNSPDVKLWINSRTSYGPSPKEIEAVIASLGATNIQYSQQALDRAHYLHAFEATDCYVSLSTGEGFSIQPREAMAMGIPVIVSDNTAQSTICKSQLVRAVPAQLEIPAFYSHFNTYYGSAFDCTVEEAADALRSVYEHYSEALASAQQARVWASQYQYTHLRALYASLIHPQRVTLGSENKITPEGIITTSASLAQKYSLL